MMDPSSRYSRRFSCTSSPPRRGTSATELAVLLPLIVGMCIAAVDLGRFGYTYIALSQAVQIGSHYGTSRDFTVHSEPDWTLQVAQAVQDEMSQVPNFDPSRLTVNVSAVDGLHGLKRIEIDAMYPFDLVLDWPGLDTPIILRRTFIARQFQ